MSLHCEHSSILSVLSCSGSNLVGAVFGVLKACSYLRAETDNGLFGLKRVMLYNASVVVLFVKDFNGSVNKNVIDSHTLCLGKPLYGS